MPSAITTAPKRFDTFERAKMDEVILYPRAPLSHRHPEVRA
jgi:hypothetical protein